MKVTTLYEPPTQELDVEITVEDITRALHEAPETAFEATQMMNAIAQSLKATTDEIIADMRPAQREVIAKFLSEQSSRFLENVESIHPESKPNDHE